MRKAKPVFIVTAGPTREFLDPVRFLSNPSTGKMGFAIAAAAARRGYRTVLISGPVSLDTPKGVRRIDVTSALDMLEATDTAVSKSKSASSIVISSAAIADWRPARCAAKKLKKSSMNGILRLVRNPDILKTLHRRYGKTGTVRLVGFAAETGDPVAEAARKCREKGLLFTVANDVTKRGSGFGTDTNRVTFVYPDGSANPLPLLTKDEVAERIVDEVLRV